MEHVVLPKLGHLRKELYGLLLFEAEEERARLEDMWRSLHEKQPLASSPGSTSTGLSPQRREALKAFVQAVAKLMSDSGFQLVTVRDLTISSALADQGVLTAEVNGQSPPLLESG